MLVQILVILGILILAYSEFRCKKYVNLLPEKRFTKYWAIMSSLIALFIAGYSTVALLNIFKFYNILEFDFIDENLVNALILFFGSIFVLLFTSLSSQTFLRIIDLQKDTQKYAQCLEKEIRRRAAETKFMSITDSLTGLFNQKYLYKKLNEETARAKRQGHNLYLAMLDIDNFRMFNNALGYSEGDRILCMIAEIVKRHTRDNVDVAFRYGNDVFAIILPELDKEQVLKVMQRIMSHINEKNIFISVGLVACHESDASAEDLLMLAETASNEAKQEGGNRIRLLQKRKSLSGLNAINQNIPENIRKYKHLRLLK